MPEAPLFYGQVTALDRDLHAELRLRPASFGFARGSHLVPAVTDEFPAACRELPILYVSGGGTPAPVFLLGTRAEENLLVAPDGTWRGRYVPAYLRRFPFIKGEVEGGEPIVLMASGSDALGDEGEPLFAEGGPTPLLRERIDLLNTYADAAARTEVLGRLLVELGLFRDVTVDFKSAEGGASTIHGLLAVDEAKLNALADPDFLRLRPHGFLAAIHSHLLSLAAIDGLAKRAGP